MDVHPPDPVAGARASDPAEVVRPLLAVGGWMRLLGGLAVAAGVLQCLTCVGLLVGWIPIWIGVLLLRSVDQLERGERTGDARELRAGVESLARAVQVKAVLALIGVVASLALLVVLVFLVLVTPARLG